ncbi:MAG: sigma-70 family RNA polymerase sigma factor [Myxococcales bacterium]|nr:sigma-70 family RNA polymerase sigma factor [Myxococcales bacterium]MCB9714478.1 sigma-70 family RNA polymerase sigma factor [Myxococcales bacterium]
MSTRPDAELVEAWGAGEREAGAELVRRHAARLHRFFRYRAGDRADDLVQATLLECVRSRGRLRDAAAFRSFLFGIAYNVLRADARRGLRDGAPQPMRSAVPAPGPSPSGAVAERHDRAQLAHALRLLPMELQVALQLHYWEELTAAEISEVLGWPLGTVKTRLRRAHRDLGETLRSTPAGASIDLERTLRSWLDDVGDA